MTPVWAFIIASASAAVNAAIYVADTTDVWNLGSAIFCGLMAVAMLVLLGKQR